MARKNKTQLLLDYKLVISESISLIRKKGLSEMKKAKTLKNEEIKVLIKELKHELDNIKLIMNEDY